MRETRAGASAAEKGTIRVRQLHNPVKTYGMRVLTDDSNALVIMRLCCDRSWVCSPRPLLAR
jgi:hypothetical protein